VIEKAARPSAKIGILTFHRCINYGSYWQARSLVTGLRARGHDAVLLDHRCERARQAEWRCAFQPLLPRRSPRSDFPQYAAKARKLIGAADALPSSPPFDLEQPEGHDPYDLVIVGSDEVWNMRHPWYGGRAAFYGEGIKAGRLVSYAASFGNHDAAEGLHPHWSERLRRFDAISVRDRNSREMLRAGLGIDPALVLDPVLQFPPELPAATEQDEEDERGPYIAVYGHSFPDWYAAAVRTHAAGTGQRLVSIGYRNDWADEQRIDVGPVSFMRLIAGSSALATNFFHGCVFALVLDRPFVCVASSYRANKLRDLTAAVGAEPRLVAEGEEARLPDLLATPLESAIAERIDRLRAQSDAYLAHVLG
jgi:hypothetical protein